LRWRLPRGVESAAFLDFDPPPLSPGSSARPREVNVIAKDYLFIPADLAFAPGETVLVHVINGGLEPHEAVIGNSASPLRHQR